MANCIFCNSNNVSKEHLWGRWWKDYYPPSEKDLLIRDTHKITVRNSNNELITKKGIFSNVGDPLGKTTKVVCQNCNNTWMSAIENEMKSSFHKLFIDEEEDLSSDDILNLKKWMYLKFCLISRAYTKIDSLISNSLNNSEKIKEKINLIQLEYWNSFLNGNNLPSEFQFYCARAKAEFKIGSFNYIPLFKAQRANLLNIEIVDTCMLINGHFIGIVTNSKTIINSINSNENLKGLLPLTNDTYKFTYDNKVNPRELENDILTILEEIKGGIKLRRNFS